MGGTRARALRGGRGGVRSPGRGRGGGTVRFGGWGRRASRAATDARMSAALDWLCLHAPKERLPEAFKNLAAAARAETWTTPRAPRRRTPRRPPRTKRTPPRTRTTPPSRASRRRDPRGAGGDGGCWVDSARTGSREPNPEKRSARRVGGRGRHVARCARAHPVNEADDDETDARRVRG